MKNKFWAFIIAILIFLPSCVAVVNYISTKGSPVTANSVSSVVMTDLYNEEYEFEKSGKEFNINDIRSNMVQYFTEVNTTSASEPELPEPLKGAKYYKVMLKNYDREVEYKYYFTKQPEHCYYLDPDNNCFSIKKEYAVAFLNSLYGRSVFEDATLPVMTTPSGEVISPTEIKWTYLCADEMASTYTAKDANVASDTVYNIAEQVKVSFLPQAGAVDVTVTANGEELYNGLYENLGFANIPTNTELTVKVNAKWYQTEERQSEGEASYTFKCRVTDKPVFSLGTNSEVVYNGDFVTVTAKNVISKPSDIQCISTPELGVTPEFYADGNDMRALVPIPLEAKGGNYSLKLVADGVEQTLEFTVTERNYSTKHENISSSVLNDEAFESFDKAMKDVFGTKSEEKYFDGEFIYPVKGSQVTSGYGRSMVTSGGYAYTNKWVRVTASSGSNVLAMNAGKVVYVGEQTMTGNTVVIDHGMGMMTVYANMVSTSVSVGDTVATGDTLGISGASGYADGSTVSVALVINGVYVCPYEIWDTDGVVFKEAEQITFTEEELKPTVEDIEIPEEEQAEE